MPSYIVKIDPDEDFYVAWSTVTDSPHIWGPRAYLEANPQYVASGPDPVAADRFDRADKTGSSANWPGWPADRQPYTWGDKTFIYQGRGVLRRSNLRALLDRLSERGENACCCDLLDPFEDDDLGRVVRCDHGVRP